MFEQRKKLSEDSLGNLKQKMDEIVSSEKAKGNERLTQLKADLDDYLRQLSLESDAMIAENKRAAVRQATENYEKGVASINPNLPSNLQNKLRESYGRILTKFIEDTLSSAKYDLKSATKKYFPEPPKI